MYIDILKLLNENSVYDEKNIAVIEACSFHKLAEELNALFALREVIRHSEQLKTAKKREVIFSDNKRYELIDDNAECLVFKKKNGEIIRLRKSLELEYQVFNCV